MTVAKLIVTTGFEWLPKVQKIAQSGHTGRTTDRYCLELDSQQKITPQKAIT